MSAGGEKNMLTIDSKAIYEALVSHILNTRFEDLDRTTVENAKNRILDVMGCMLGGANAPGNPELVRLAADWGGKKEAAIIGHGVRVPVATAAMINCIMCRSFDMEPLVTLINGRRYAGHRSATTVPTAITLADSRSINGKELITSLVVGDDIAVRLFAATGSVRNTNIHGQPASGPGPGFQPLGVITSFGATTIAGRILGLTPFQLKNAFGIAIDEVGEVSGGLWEGATTFKLGQGSSARNGIVAVELAKAGWIGVPDPLFGEHGSYYGTLTQGSGNIDLLIGDLGKKYYTEQVFKSLPGGRPTHAPVEAALALTQKYDFKANDIAEVVLRLSPPARYPHFMKPYKVGDYPMGDALFSYRFSAANALYRKCVRHEHYTEEYIRDSGLQALITKVKLADLDQPEGIELEIKLNDGRVFSRNIRAATGEVPHTLSREALAAKFLTQVEYSGIIPMNQAHELLEMLDRLEETDNVSQIVELAVKR
jgi:2-methylcitrate dehydratase PrpD